MSNLLNRLLSLYRIRAAETRLDGIDKTLELPLEPIELMRCLLQRDETRRRLSKYRADYQSTFPPGQRKTWRTA